MNKKSIKLFVQNHSIVRAIGYSSVTPLLHYPLFPLHFNSVEQILTQLEQQPGWEKFKEYRQLLKCWNNTVNQTTAEHTRPLYIARQVLWVAASNASRAQELSFQRYTLLKRLNKQLPFTLKDIRFSSSQWHQTQQPKTQPTMFSASKKQKSKVNSLSKNTPQERGDFLKETRYRSSYPKQRDLHTSLSSSTTAKDAARRWLKTLQQSSSSLLSCPNCHCYTPKEEIERWNLCHHCVATKWSKEYRPPSFPEIE